MVIKLNMTSGTPIYMQLRNQIILGISRGDLPLGERLPTVRQLAADTGVNTMTVNKAYALLKQEGYIEIDRRHGAKVVAPGALEGDGLEKLEDELALLIAETKLHGMDRDRFLQLCDNLYMGTAGHPGEGTT